MLNKVKSLCFVLACATAIVGCSASLEGKPIAQNDYFKSQIDLNKVHTLNLKGKMALRAYHNVSGIFVYDKAQDNLKLDLLSPFAVPIASVKANAQEATIIANNKSYTGNNASDLFYELLQVRIPVEQLNDILLANIKSCPLKYANGLNKNCVYQGYLVTYSDYMDYNNIAMPTNITIENTQLRLKLRIENIFRLEHD